MSVSVCSIWVGVSLPPRRRAPFFQGPGSEPALQRGGSRISRVSPPPGLHIALVLAVGGCARRSGRRHVEHGPHHLSISRHLFPDPYRTCRLLGHKMLALTGDSPDRPPLRPPFVALSAPSICFRNLDQICRFLISFRIVTGFVDF